MQRTTDEFSIKIKPHMQLSREELLSGKCMPESPDEKSKMNSDKGIKSPDSILLRAIKKKKELNQLKLDRNNEDNGEKPAEIKSTANIEKSANDMKGEASSNQQSHFVGIIHQMQKKHSEEIKKWLSYEKQIHSWREQVLTVVKRLKKEADQTTRLRSELIAKEQELQALKTGMLKKRKK